MKEIALAIIIGSGLVLGLLAILVCIGAWKE